MVQRATPNEGYEGEGVIVDPETEADILRMGQSTRLWHKISFESLEFGASLDKYQ
jgi:hypothetical protein